MGWILSEPSLGGVSFDGLAFFLGIVVTLILLKRSLFLFYVFQILFLINYFYFSLGSVADHSLYGFLYLAIFSLGMKGNYSLFEQENRLPMNLSMAALASIYTSSGLWKIRSMMSLDSFNDIAALPKNYIAYNVFEGLKPLAYSKGHEDIYTIAFMAAVLLQTLSFLPLLIPKCRKWWGFGLIAFHVGTAVFMDVWFLEMAAAVAIVFILPEVYRKDSAPIVR
jgi:hypothetical protein